MTLTDKEIAKKKPLPAWCVITDERVPVLISIRDTRKESIRAYCKWANKFDWEHYRSAAGFRCIKIILTEYKP